MQVFRHDGQVIVRCEQGCMTSYMADTLQDAIDAIPVSRMPAASGRRNTFSGEDE